ncbi:hypothetical protein Si024_00230 [Streptococcus infantarius subsp. infantarius]|nr:hypothetical protein [Streptococcus infantarius subsp. infantarius]
MIELRDIIDLFHMSNNNSILIVDNCETFEYGEDDITDKLSHIVDLIDIDDDRVKIYLENYTIPLYK